MSWSVHRDARAMDMTPYCQSIAQKQGTSPSRRVRRHRCSAHVGRRRCSAQRRTRNGHDPILPEHCSKAGHFAITTNGQTQVQQGHVQQTSLGQRAGGGADQPSHTVGNPPSATIQGLQVVEDLRACTLPRGGHRIRRRRRVERVHHCPARRSLVALAFTAAVALQDCLHMTG